MADLRFLLTSGLLVLALLIGAVVIGVFRRWREMSERGHSANEQLAQFRSLYEKGEISEAEFHRLRELLGPDIRKETGLDDLPKKPTPPPSDGVTPG